MPDLFNTAVLIIYKPPLKQKAWIVCISDECFGSKIKRCLIFSLILLRLPVQESHSTSWCKISGPACIHNGTTSNTQNQKKISALYCPWLGLSSGRFQEIQGFNDFKAYTYRLYSMAANLNASRVFVVTSMTFHLRFVFKSTDTVA